MLSDSRICRTIERVIEAKSNSWGRFVTCHIWLDVIDRTVTKDAHGQGAQSGPRPFIMHSQMPQPDLNRPGNIVQTRCHRSSTLELSLELRTFCLTPVIASSMLVADDWPSSHAMRHCCTQRSLTSSGSRDWRVDSENRTKHPRPQRFAR